VRPLLTDR